MVEKLVERALSTRQILDLIHFIDDGDDMHMEKNRMAQLPEQKMTQDTHTHKTSNCETGWELFLSIK